MSETKKTGCAFCKQFSKLRRYNEELRKQIGATAPAYQHANSKLFKCAIIFYYFQNRMDDGHDYTLNFCPECGRRLNMGERI